MNKFIKKILSVLLFMSAVVLSGCEKKEVQIKTHKSKCVETVVAQSVDLTEMIETTGDIVAVNTVVVRATVEGPISFCPWREGDLVETIDQKLIEIDRPFYRKQVQSAQASLLVAKAKLADLVAGARPEEIVQAKELVRQLEDRASFAKVDLDRNLSLVDSGSLPAEMAEKARVDYVKCESDLSTAKEQLAILEHGPTQTEIAVAQAVAMENVAKLELAQAKLDECFLDAPFAGVITQVYVKPGDLATPGKALLKMIDKTSLVVRLGLPEVSSTHITKGTNAVVTLDAYPEKTFNAMISRIYPSIEMESRTRIVELEISDDIDLLPRMFARVLIQGRVMLDAVVVPDEAIISNPRGERFVFVIEDGKANIRKIVLGIEQHGNIQILDGISAGDVVITVGNLNLKNGDSVKSLNKKSSENQPLTNSEGKVK